MPAFDLLNHLINFAAPALFMALVMVFGARWAARKKTAALSLKTQLAIQFTAGLAVLLLGLAGFGHDGKMTTYLLLVLVSGTTQWLLGRSWKS